MGGAAWPMNHASHDVCEGLYFALQQNTQFHHLVCVAGTFESLLLVHVLSWAFTLKTKRFQIVK